MERNNKKYDDITSPIYNTLHREYEATRERGRSIDGRAGVFLTFLFTAFPFYIEIIDIGFIKSLLKKTCYNVFEVLIMITFFMSLVVFLTVFILFLSVLSTRRYQVINNSLFKGFNIVDYEDADVTVNDVNASLILYLDDCIDFNTKVTNKKAKIFNIALWTCLLYIALMIMTIIYKLL